MKNTLYILVLMSITIIACKKECQTFASFPPEPLIFTFFDDLGNNLLDPSSPQFRSVDKIKLTNGNHLEFFARAHIYSEDFHNIQISFKSGFTDMCLNQDCEFYITYSNSTRIDTLNSFIEEQTITNEDGCKTTTYNYKYNKLNNVTSTENHAGVTILHVE